MSKKLIIAISALALAIIAGVVAVVGVFAAQQQKVANTFTISYTANNVVGGITGQFYYKENANASGSMPDGYFNAYFSAEEAEQTKTMSPNITLSAQNPGVKLAFIIENGVSKGGRRMSITLTDTTAVKENINVYYAYTTDQENGPYSLTYDQIAVEANKTLPETMYLDAYSTAGCLFVFVVIEIADPTLDAKYETTIDNGLHFAFESVE